MSKEANQSIYRQKPGLSQNITSSGTAANNSTAFEANTSIIRISATAAIRYRVGPSAVAVATDARLPADAIEYVGIVKGDRLSVIQESAGGTVSVTEMTR